MHQILAKLSGGKLSIQGIVQCYRMHSRGGVEAGSLTVPRRACSRPRLLAAQASMQSAPSLSSRRDSRPAPPGLGEMAANASQGIVGILSSALPEITRVGVRGKPSCMPCTMSQGAAEKLSVRGGTFRHTIISMWCIRV